MEQDYNYEEFCKRDPVVFESKHYPHFSDLDPFGHLNTECYLQYFFKHRFIGMRETIDLDYSSIFKLPILFVTKSTTVNFYRPVFADDEFVIKSHVKTVKENSCSVICKMYNSKDNMVSDCSFELICVDKRTQRPTKWPVDFISTFFK